MVYPWIVFLVPVGYRLARGEGVSRGVNDGRGGGVAQLGERLNGIQEVRGSIPLASMAGPLLAFIVALMSRRRHGLDWVRAF